MKAIILGKTNSVRVRNKNYRPFIGESSLMDIHIAKLVKVLDRSDIFLSCEDEAYRYVAEKWGINFIHREEKYTLITTSNVDVVRNICKDIPYNEEILWTTPVEPLFDEYAEVVDCWNGLDKSKYDSLNVVYPQKRFFLDQNHNPIGFGFGHWHKYSQEIPHGIENFTETGAVFICVIQHDYCKFIVIMMPGQKYPLHYHRIKDESFFVLYGDLTITIEDNVHVLSKGDILNVPRRFTHSFATKNGCVFEEISTAYLKHYDKHKNSKN